jgi:DNA polymerase III sliding clamp (beta) subunit (PCNA family)
MRLKVNTKKLQDMVSKAMKCASCVGDIPLTGMLALELKEGKLTVTTTDENTYLYLTEDCTGDDFYVVVDVAIFSKLISKITSEDVEMKVVNGTLEIKGNGNYTLELPYDGEGELVKFPDVRSKLTDGDTVKMSLSTLKMIHATAGASLDTTKGYHGCYTGYYLGEEAITTDSFKVCIVNTKVFDKPVLVTATTMDMIELLSGEEIEVTKNDKYIMFKSDRCTVFSQLMPYLDDFQVDAIKKVVQLDTNASCIVDKATLLGVLDRLSLFVTKMDENGIYITFRNSEMQIASKQTDGVEVIEYRESIATDEFTCCVDIEKFTSQVKSVLADTVEIFFGKSEILKIEDGNITKVIALFDEE